MCVRSFEGSKLSFKRIENYQIIYPDRTTINTSKLLPVAFVAEVDLAE
jgi:hypothetical protein